MNVNTAWSRDVALILKELEVPADKGLAPAVAEERLRKFGPNAITTRVPVSRWNILLKQITNPVVFILLIAAGVSFFLGEALEAWVILAIVVINSLIGYFQEAKAESAIEALADLSGPKGKVLRDGHVLTVASEAVVPGDILVLEAGDYVVADARVLTSRQLAADEAVLTGESLPIDKNPDPIEESSVLADRTNMVFAGTAISRGTGKAVVTATGLETEIGKIASMMESTSTDKTPLQARLEVVSHKLLLAGMAVIACVIAMGIWKKNDWQDIIMSALSLSVAAIPEGLPTIVTIALVLAVRRMSKRCALVRKMDSVETLGATDVICTDKTGTLTTGKMTVRETWALDERKFLETIALCNNASLHGSGSGDTTEIALLKHAAEKGIDLPLLRKENPRLFEWSFDSGRKRMSVAVRSPAGTVFHVKGAPEKLLPHCTLDEAKRHEISGKISEYSRKGMRVLATAMKAESVTDFAKVSADEAESHLTFTGLVAMADPPREESISSIRKCREAGIRVIMMTGDHPETAFAIARELGLLTDGKEKVMTGQELDKLPPQELHAASETVTVFARVSPENKLSLVKELRKSGHVVAMTGDGVNDAPALKASSIGVSMGKGGTEVARQASSIVLTDDNFSTIVDAVEEGRAVHGNIKRTLQYLLSTNLAELLFIFISVLLGFPVPLLPVNLLWLNLVTDGLPSLALAAESVHEDYLRQSQRTSPETFFDRAFVKEMVVVGTIITCMSVGIYVYGVKTADVLTGRSYAFNFIVYTILFRSFSCRHERLTFFQMKPNYYLLASVIIPVIFQMLIQESGIFLRAFRVTSLDFRTNVILLGLSIVPVTLTELAKYYRQLRRS